MANIIRMAASAILRLLGLVQEQREDPAESARRTLDVMRARLAELKAVSAKAAACEYQIERALAAEREIVGGIDDSELRAAGEARVVELESQLAATRAQCEEVGRQMLAFREEIERTSTRMRDAQALSQLSAMRAQAEKLAMESRIEEGLAAVDRMESKASHASAQARALAELNEALRDRGDDDEHQ